MSRSIACFKAKFTKYHSKDLKYYEQDYYRMKNSLKFENLFLQDGEISISFDMCSHFLSAPIPQTLKFLRAYCKITISLMVESMTPCHLMNYAWDKIVFRLKVILMNNMVGMQWVTCHSKYIHLWFRNGNTERITIFSYDIAKEHGRRFF